MTAGTSLTKMRHEELVALYASGWTKKALAQRFGYTIEYVRELLRDPDYQEMVRGLQLMNVQKNMSEALELLKDSSTEAILTIRHLMRTAVSENVRLAAANSLLDRVGISKKNILEVNTNKAITDDAAKFIMQVFEESRAPAPALEMVQDSGGVFTIAEDEDQVTSIDYVGGYGGPPDD